MQQYFNEGNVHHFVAAGKVLETTKVFMRVLDTTMEGKSLNDAHSLACCL